MVAPAVVGVGEEAQRRTGVEGRRKAWRFSQGRCHCRTHAPAATYEGRRRATAVPAWGGLGEKRARDRHTHMTTTRRGPRSCLFQPGSDKTRLRAREFWNLFTGRFGS